MTDELDGQIFTCMNCDKKFSIKEGTFPQYNFSGEMVMDDNNNRSVDEFVCYDCCD